MFNSKNFQIDVKGLVFDKEGRLMLLKEPGGSWDLPGGRMEHGENFQQAIKRECQEEMGVHCKLLDEQPYYVWPVYWKNRDTYLIYLAFRIELDSFDFKHSNECVGYDFFDMESIKKVNAIDAIQPLFEWLRKNS